LGKNEEQIVGTEFRTNAKYSLAYISPNSTWLVTSRLDTTRRVRRVEPCCATSSTQPKCMGSTGWTCRIVSRRDV